MNSKYFICEILDWISLEQYMDHWLAHVNMVMDFHLDLK
jgi:hypothetical protein